MGLLGFPMDPLGSTRICTQNRVDWQADTIVAKFHPLPCSTHFPEVNLLGCNPNQLYSTGIPVPVGYVVHPAVAGQSGKLPQSKAVFAPLLWNCIALTGKLGAAK